MRDIIIPKSVTKDKVTKANNLGTIPNTGTKLKKAIADINKSDQARVNYTIFDRGITATAGGGQANAYLLSTKEIQIVETCATNNDSVKLPVVETGIVIKIVNKGAATLTVFPTTGQDVDGATNGSTDILTGESQVFYGVSGTEWLTI